MSPMVASERTALKATGVPRLMRESTIVNGTDSRTEFKGILKRGETRRIQLEKGRPLSRLFWSASVVLLRWAELTQMRMSV